MRLAAQLPGTSALTPPNASDMGGVKRRGGKMMVYHGTSDPIFSSDDTTN